MVYYQDQSFATLVTEYVTRQLSTFSQPPDSIMGKVSMIPISYGNETIDRVVQDPDTIVHGSKQFDPNRAPKVTLKQNVDCVNLSDGLFITRQQFSTDPEGSRIQVENTGSIFRNSVEKTLIEGISTIAIARGISDYPSGTTGTINRAEIAYNNSTAGDWSTTSNIRSDIISSLAGLILKRFYGPYLILAPTIVQPMLTEVIANTAQPINTWVKSTVGVSVAYSPFVHEAATTDDFNVYIIDTSKVHIGLSTTKFDAWYEKKDHCYYWDWECYMAPLFDPLYDGTEYLKGVARLDARDWDDPE